MDNLRRWTERNSVVSRDEQINFQHWKERILQTSQRQWMKNHCIFCKEPFHKTTDCKEVTNINRQKRIEASKKLSFNCLCEDQKIIECKSKETCCNCNIKHHTSICCNSVEQEPNGVTEGVRLVRSHHPREKTKIKLQCFRKIRIWTFGSLLYQINSF